MKEIFRVVAGGLVATAMWVGTAAAQDINIATIFPDTNFHTQNLMRFSEEVREKTSNEVDFSIMSGGSLGFKGPELLSAVRDGLVPAADITGGFLVGEEPFLGVEAIPFLLASYNDVRLFREIVRPAFEAIAERHNQKVMYIVPWGPQYTFLNQKVGGLNGLEGKRIRVSDKNAQDLFGALGANAILMPWSEVVPALATGRIEGVATSSTSAADGKFWEFLDTIIPTNHLWGSQMLTINLDVWNSVSEENRDIISGIARELEGEFTQASIADEERKIPLLIENGMTMLELTDEDRAVMQKISEQLRAEFISRVPEAESVVEEFLKQKQLQ